MKRLLLLMLLCVISGCGTSGEFKAYVESDRATFEAISTQYLEYVGKDESLDEEQKQRRERLIGTWGLRIEQGEALGKDKE